MPKGIRRWKQPFERVLRPREGFKDVSTRMDTLVQIGPQVGPQVFGKKRKPLHEETR